MSDRRSPEFPLLFLHAAARYLALRRVMQREGSTPATMYCATAAAPALPDDFLSTLLQAAGLADPEADTLTPRARTWLAQPLPLQLDTLRQAWWHTVAWDSQALPSLRFPPWLSARWSAVITIVCSWLTTLPTPTWTPTAQLHTHLQRQQLHTPPGYGQNLPYLRRSAAEHVTTLADLLLLIIFPALGLGEARRQAASWYARPTPEGKRWLTVALERRQTYATVAQELTVC